VLKLRHYELLCTRIFKGKIIILDSKLGQELYSQFYLLQSAKILLRPPKYEKIMVPYNHSFSSLHPFCKVGRAITKWGSIQKSPILKNFYFERVTKIISHFDSSNNIFADCNYYLIFCLWLMSGAVSMLM